MNTAQPLVSVVTPVYNEEQYLAECIESVIAQTYSNWDYTIVDNCSTDHSVLIAQEYARRDPRIRIVKNEVFVGAIENHNIAFRHISKSSVYCKLLSGDDWMYPEFLERSVKIAESYPNVGVVASYSINTQSGFRWPKLDPYQTVYDGRDIGRLFLLGLIDSFFAPSVVMYRSSLVRGEAAFYPGTAPSADLSACLNCLTTSDLGFVHQILSFERIHEQALSAEVKRMETYLLDRIRILNELGARFLSDDEHAARLDALLTEYYETVLVPAIFSFRERAFWRLHKARLKDMGYPLLGSRLAAATAKKTIDLLFNPKLTAEKVVRRLTEKKKDSGGSVARSILGDGTPRGAQ